MKTPFDSAIGTIVMGLMFTLVLYFIVHRLVLGG